MYVIHVFLILYIISTSGHIFYDQDCSNFKAGNLLRSQKNQKKLDVTGVFGVACRHEMPLVFLNMTEGER